LFIFTGSSDPFGGGQVPQGMKLDHDIHLVADGVADFGEWLQRAVQVGARDIGAVRSLGICVEGPDFHPGDALLQQAFGQFIGTVQERVQVFVRAGRGLRIQAPVFRRLSGFLAHVAIAGAGVVCADPFARQPAQQLVNGLAGRLAENVPQRDVDGR
jgi:hypothetical protein